MRAATGIASSLYSDVSASFRGEYGRTSWHDADRVLHADVSVR